MSDGARKLITPFARCCEVHSRVVCFPAALKVLDVNLRPPYDSAERVWPLFRQAALVKLNEPAPPADMASTVRRVPKCAGVGKICLTAGATGGIDFQ
jgi:hypothetical protein